MTHGHLLITQKGWVDHHLYAYHDGHTKEALNDLMSMPFLLHDLAAEQAMREWSDDFEYRFRSGPWHLQVLMLRNRLPKTFEDVQDDFRSQSYFEACPPFLANCMVACRFDRWHPAWRASQRTYPGPDIRVACDGGGYRIHNAGKRQLDYFVEDVQRILPEIEKRQKTSPTTRRSRTTKRRTSLPYRSASSCDVSRSSSCKTPRRRKWPAAEMRTSCDGSHGRRPRSHNPKTVFEEFTVADRKQRKTLQARAQRDKRVEPEEPEVPEPKAERRPPEPKLDLTNLPPPFARGALTWPADERISGRYGFIGLQDETRTPPEVEPDSEPLEIEDAHLDVTKLIVKSDKTVHLVITVVDGPQVGERVVVGPGKLVWFEDPYSPTLLTGRWFGVWFGLMPDNPLKLTAWMDSEKLRRVLHRTVDVSILPV